MPTNVTNAAETNVITTAQMVRAREIDFVNRFNENILAKLNEAMGVTRKIPMTEGTTMYVYKTTGTLQSGNVPEGEIIPRVIKWNERKSSTIRKILHACTSPTEFEGIRYTILIGSAEKYLYKAGDKWYVEIKE